MEENSPETKEYLGKVAEMFLKGQIRPIISKYFKFDEISLAHSYVDSGRKVGSVVISY